MDSTGDNENKKSKLAKGLLEQGDHPLLRIPTLRRSRPTRLSERPSSSDDPSGSSQSSRRDLPQQRQEPQRKSSASIQQQPMISRSWAVSVASSKRSKTPAAETLQTWFSSKERQQDKNEEKPSTCFQPTRTHESEKKSHTSIQHQRSVSRARAVSMDKSAKRSKTPAAHTLQHWFSSSKKPARDQDPSIRWKPSYLRRTKSLFQYKLRDPDHRSSVSVRPYRQGSPWRSLSRDEDRLWNPNHPTPFRTRSDHLQDSEDPGTGPSASSRQQPERFPLPSTRGAPSLIAMSVEPSEEALFPSLYFQSERPLPTGLDLDVFAENGEVVASGSVSTIPKTRRVKSAYYKAPKERIATGKEAVARRESAMKRMKDEEGSEVVPRGRLRPTVHWETMIF